MSYAPAFARFATPVGMVEVEATADTLLRVHLPVNEKAEERRGESPVRDEAVRQLKAYFAGKLRDFDLPLTPAASPRGQALRDGMASIGYGESMSYGALARILSSGPRAIGQACARNPYPIIVPCHRVIGAQGALGHYSAGEGTKTKQWLLAHEEENRA